MGPTDIKSMNPAKRKTRKSNLLETRIVLAQLARKRTRSHDATLPKKPVNEPKFYFPKDMVEDLDEVYDFYELGATCSPIVKKDAQKRRKQKKIGMNIVETRDPDGMNHVTETKTDTKQEGKNTEMKKDENEGDEERNSYEETEIHAYVTDAGQNKMEVETTFVHEKEMYNKIDGIANSSVSDIDDLLGRIHDEPPMLEQDQLTKPPVVEETCNLPPPCTQQLQPEPLESGLKARPSYRSAKKAVVAGRNSMDTNMLIDILIEHVKMGTLQKSKLTATICNAIIDDFSKRLGKSCSKNQIKKRYYRLRQRYMHFKELTEHLEFAWNSTTHSLTADKEVWDEFVKGHSWAKRFRKTGCPDYSKLCIIFGDPQSNQTKPRAFKASKESSRRGQTRIEHTGFYQGCGDES